MSAMASWRSALSLVRQGVAFELAIYRSLYRWVARRPVLTRPGQKPFGYAQAVTPVLWLWIFASAMEIPLFHLLLPWQTAQVISLVLGAWGLLWMLGYMAGLRVYPHLLDDQVLRVRNGARIDVPIPLEAIASIKATRRDLPSSMRSLQPRETPDGTDLQVGVSGQVNVHVVLRRPLTVPTPKEPMEITEISFLVDDPRAFVARTRQLLTSDVAQGDQPR